MTCTDCPRPIASSYLNTMYGPMHVDCWLRRTAP